MSNLYVPISPREGRLLNIDMHILHTHTHTHIVNTINEDMLGLYVPVSPRKRRLINIDMHTLSPHILAYSERQKTTKAF